MFAEIWHLDEQGHTDRSTLTGPDIDMAVHGDVVEFVAGNNNDGGALERLFVPSGRLMLARISRSATP